MSLLHATCVALDDTAVLLRGPSGSGKSDLALRLIDSGGELVGDDYVEVAPDGEGLVASPPAEIAGRMEVRGVGLAAVTWRDRAVVRLVVDLVEPETVDRLPEPAYTEIEGVRLPLVRLAPFEASTAAKVRIALRVIGQDGWSL